MALYDWQTVGKSHLIDTNVSLKIMQDVPCLSKVK